MSSSTTPVESISAKRSASRNRLPSSRPTTPLRPSSRSSLRDSQNLAGKISTSSQTKFPLDALELGFAELSDSMADLEANFMHLQVMHESLARFSESFGSFLYGLNMNAFCVDFPEAPGTDSFKRAKQREEQQGSSPATDRYRQDYDGDMTFMTTDTSFVDNPPPSSRTGPKYATPAPASKAGGPSHRGNIGGVSRGGRGLPRGARSSGLARARGRGVR